MEISKLTVGAFNKINAKHTVINPALNFVETNIKTALNIHTPEVKIKTPDVDVFQEMKGVEQIERNYRMKADIAKSLGSVQDFYFLM